MQKLVRSIVGAAALIGGASAHAQGFIYFLYGTNKTLMQTGAYIQTYESGNFSALMRDGLYVIEPCPSNGSATPFPPGGACAIGSTAFVASGDLNLDGLRDDLSYYQVTSIIPNQLIAPFVPQRALLFAAPNGADIHDKIGKNGYAGFLDDSVMVFFNLLTDDVLQFNQARYQMTMPFTSLGSIDNTFPFGAYKFKMPTIQNPPIGFVTFEGLLKLFAEPFQPTSVGNKEDQFRFSNNVNQWDGEFMELDPRLPATITWNGTRAGQVLLNDRLYFSVYDGLDLSARFPPSGGRVRLPNPLNNSTILPPYFFSAGVNGVAHLEIERGNRDLNVITQEMSSRTFKYKIRFIDTYAGFSTVAFPVGTDPARRAPGADYDGDTFSNLIEYAYQSDVTNTNPFVAPTPPETDPLTFKVEPPLVTAVRTVTIAKRLGVGNSLIYGFQISFDGGNTYSTITGASHPGWHLVVPETVGALVLQSDGNIPNTAIIRPYALQRPGYESFVTP